MIENFNPAFCIPIVCWGYELEATVVTAAIATQSPMVLSDWPAKTGSMNMYMSN